MEICRFIKILGEDWEGGKREIWSTEEAEREVPQAEFDPGNVPQSDSHEMTKGQCLWGQTEGNKEQLKQPKQAEIPATQECAQRLCYQKHEREFLGNDRLNIC